MQELIEHFGAELALERFAAQTQRAIRLRLSVN
jgi:hypothetical protein